eukprot:7384031-Prymnesium_polylepis.1
MCAHQRRSQGHASCQRWWDTPFHRESVNPPRPKTSAAALAPFLLLVPPPHKARKGVRPHARDLCAQHALFSRLKWPTEALSDLYVPYGRVPHNGAGR